MTSHEIHLIGQFIFLDVSFLLTGAILFSMEEITGVFFDIVVIIKPVCF